MRLRTKDTSFWVTVNNVRLEVSPRPAGEQDRLLNACITKTYKRGGREDREIDSAKYNTELFVRTVRAWEGAEDEHGQPLECTVENKRAVAENNIVWAQDVLDAADAGKEATDRDEKKISSTSLAAV